MFSRVSLFPDLKNLKDISMDGFPFRHDLRLYGSNSR